MWNEVEHFGIDSITNTSQKLLMVIKNHLSFTIWIKCQICFIETNLHLVFVHEQRTIKSCENNWSLLKMRRNEQYKDKCCIEWRWYVMFFKGTLSNHFVTSLCLVIEDCLLGWFISLKVDFDSRVNMKSLVTLMAFRKRYNQIKSSLHCFYSINVTTSKFDTKFYFETVCKWFMFICKIYDLFNTV